MTRKRKRPSTDVTKSGPTFGSLGGMETTKAQFVPTTSSGTTRHPLLTLLSGVNAGQVFAIEQADSVVGRTREASVRIDAVGVSRRHARIVSTGPGTFAIEDLGSTNGVFVNGERVQRADLTPGDQIQIGSEAVLRFNMADAAEEDLARQLFESSTRDALTGAVNRTYFMGRLQAEVAYADRHHVRVGLVLFDLDHFKKINDSHGHVAGDAVLRNVGLTVAHLLRVDDVFARYGGEEFAVLARGVGAESGLRLAERIRAAVAASSVSWESSELRVTLSAGAAILGEQGTRDARGLIELADVRLYRAKESGRNRVVAT